MLGETVRVIVDRPLGSTHPKWKDIRYPVNYGYVEGVLAPDGEGQDVYILGVEVPLEEFVGQVIAVIHRFDDVEEKWVAAPPGKRFSREEIAARVAFQERLVPNGDPNVAKALADGSPRGLFWRFGAGGPSFRIE